MTVGRAQTLSFACGVQWDACGRRNRVDIFLDIVLYSVVVLIGLTVSAGACVLVGKWFADNSEEPES